MIICIYILTIYNKHFVSYLPLSVFIIILVRYDDLGFKGFIRKQNEQEIYHKIAMYSTSDQFETSKVSEKIDRETKNE